MCLIPALMFGGSIFTMLIFITLTISLVNPYALFLVFVIGKIVNTNQYSHNNAIYFQRH